MNDMMIQVSQPEMTLATTKAEIDMQIATAKAYPRDLSAVLNQIKTYATMDTETAEDCFYALRRGSERGGSVIEGVSVRLAEIIAGAWGNLRIATRIVGNDGKMITAQAVAHDLERNVAISVNVPRRITDKSGKTYSEDMQVVTANAASAIAFRNAVLKVVPKAVTKKVIDEIRQVALGKSIDLETRRQRMFQYFNTIGVTDKELLGYCGVKTIEQIDNQMVFELRGLANAIKEGSTTVKETFRGGVADSAKEAEKIKAAAKAKVDKVADAMAKATKAVDTLTGEAIDVTEVEPEKEKGGAYGK